MEVPYVGVSPSLVWEFSLYTIFFSINVSWITNKTNKALRKYKYQFYLILRKLGHTPFGQQGDGFS